MFGSAVHIINIGQSDESQVMPDVFGYWVLDAFQHQYELGLGTSPAGAYGEAEESHEYFEEIDYP